jgi:Rod binding domain-containing protein
MSISPVSAATTAPVSTLVGPPLVRAGQTPAEQAKAAAGQFEAILLRQFLQESIGSMMGCDKAGAEGNVYGYLLTDVLASKLASGGGLGLSKILQQQLTPRGASAAATGAAASPTP